MSHPAYPSPPYSNQDPIDPNALKSLLASTWQILEQPPPPTLREILGAYKSKGDGDRDMLLAMLNAKTAEDQRIAAMASLHQKMLEAHPPSSRPSQPSANPATYSSQPPPFHNSPTLPRISPSGSPRPVTLPSMPSSSNPRKRPRSSQSPPPMRRRSSAQSHPYHPPSDQLPPSPPFSSPGRSTAHTSELSVGHSQTRGAMAIGSLLSSANQSHQHDADSEWPSRTSAERTGSASSDRDASYPRQSKASG